MLEGVQHLTVAVAPVEAEALAVFNLIFYHFPYYRKYLGDEGFNGASGPEGGADSQGLDDNGQYKHIVHVRGLPYRATEREITNFFRPMETLACRIIFGRYSSPFYKLDRDISIQ